MLVLQDRAEWQYSDREKNSLEVFLVRTSRGNKVACMHAKCSSQTARSKYTLLFSHGNAVDLAARLGVNIFSYDYSGYGASSGKPTEKNIYSDIDAAFQHLRQRYGVSPENIILYGQSIGTVPTVDLACKYQ